MVRGIWRLKSKFCQSSPAKFQAHKTSVTVHLVGIEETQIYGSASSPGQDHRLH